MGTDGARCAAASVENRVRESIEKTQDEKKGEFERRSNKITWKYIFFLTLTVAEKKKKRKANNTAYKGRKNAVVEIALHKVSHDS